jgi:hypothetical protein
VLLNPSALALLNPKRYRASEFEAPEATMARIPPLDAPYPAEVAAQLASMMPAGMAPIGL